MILADENIDYRIVKELREAGYDVIIKFQNTFLAKMV